MGTSHDPCVLRHGDEWVMFYFGLCSDGHARNAYARSSDLKSWQKGGVLVDVGPPGSIDSLHAHKPAVIRDGERLFHFYTAVSAADVGSLGDIDYDQRRGISLATNRRL